MRISRVMIAAPKSQSGKTMLTCGLLQALKNAGIPVASYKCGPDYIDPMFHETVLGVPSRNLDTFFTGEDETRKLFLQGRNEADLAVLEGVMGLYDGLGGIRKEGSSYHLAEVTKTPVILVVDAKGMGRSLLPLLAGFLAYDSAKLIRGVILNRTSGSFFETIAPLIEKELKIPVLGFLPEQKDLRIESRHLGLLLPQEIADIRNEIEKLAKRIQETISIEKIIGIANTAVPIFFKEQERRNMVFSSYQKEKPVIAVARDEAFCFYYEDNLRMLEECGGRLCYFSPLRDQKLPEGAKGILLGGGYPELYAKTLSENHALMEQIRKAVIGGMPVVAECGGFMYLHEILRDAKETPSRLVGIFSGECHNTGHLVRFGYVELEERNANFLSEKERIRGHEFHYYDSTDNGRDCILHKPVTGKMYESVIDRENCFAGFPHLYYPSNPSFPRNFIAKATAYEPKKEGEI